MKKIKSLPKWAIVTLCVLGFALLYAVRYIVQVKVGDMTEGHNEQKAYKIYVAETAKGDLHDDFFFAR